jgi:HK97 family phage prohead protease
MVATFGNIDSDRDRLHKGCFKQSIEQRGPDSNANSKILLLWQHDRKEPIGRITRLKEKNEGLYFESELDEGVARADQALKQLESGTINNFSIGFQYDWETMEYNHIEDCFEVFSVKLFEISPVSIPADTNTYYMGLKSAEDFDRAEYELSEQIKESIKKLDINQQREFGELFMLQKSLSRALSASELKERIKQSTVETNGDMQPKPLFAGIKFNK